MLYRSDIVTEGIKSWEELVIKLSEYAEVQKPEKKMAIHQTVYAVQDDIFRLKSLMRSLKRSPHDKTRLKETLIQEMFQKTLKLIENNSYFKELRFNTSKFNNRNVPK